MPPKDMGEHQQSRLMLALTRGQWNHQIRKQLDNSFKSLKKGINITEEPRSFLGKQTG